MNNEIKHFNPNHDKLGRFTYTRNSGRNYSNFSKKILKKTTNLMSKEEDKNIKKTLSKKEKNRIIKASNYIIDKNKINDYNIYSINSDIGRYKSTGKRYKNTKGFRIENKKTKHYAQFRFNDNPKSNDIKSLSVSYGKNYFKRQKDLENIVKKVYGVSQDDIKRYYANNSPSNANYNTVYVPMYYY